MQADSFLAPSSQLMDLMPTDAPAAQLLNLTDASAAQLL